MSNLSEPPIDRLERQYATQKALNPDGADNLTRDFFAAVEHIRTQRTPVRAPFPSDLTERIEALKAFTSNRPAEYCHMYANALKVIEEMRQYMGDASARKDEDALASGSYSPAPECAVHATAHLDGTSTPHGCSADCPARHLGEVAASEISVVTMLSQAAIESIIRRHALGWINPKPGEFADYIFAKAEEMAKEIISSYPPCATEPPRDAAPDPRGVKALLKEVYFHKVSTDAAFDALGPYLRTSEPVMIPLSNVVNHLHRTTAHDFEDLKAIVKYAYDAAGVPYVD